MDVARLDALPARTRSSRPWRRWFEGAPRFLRRLAAARPFGDETTLFERAEAIALAMPEDEQVELIDAHPRLGAPPASVSAMSHREQGYDRETTEAIAELARLNEHYEAQFGFRYCVFVDGPLAGGARAGAGGRARAQTVTPRSGGPWSTSSRSPATARGAVTPRPARHDDARPEPLRQVGDPRSSGSIARPAAIASAT